MSKSHRPNGLKRLWRSLKQTKARVDIEEIPKKQEVNGQQEVQEEESYDTSPPPYTQSPTNDGDKNPVPPNRNDNEYPLLTQGAYDVEDPQSICSGFFFCILIEIMAVTFPTDFVRLKAYIKEKNPEWSSSSHLQQPFSLFPTCTLPIVAELTTLVRKLEDALANNRWLFVDERDKALIRKWVLSPAKAHKLNLEYVLEVLGRYECLEGYSAVEYRGGKKTLLDHWMPLSPSTQPKNESTMLDG